MRPGVERCGSNNQGRTKGLGKLFSTTDQSVVEQCMIFFECHHVQDHIREKNEIPTQISNFTESVVYDI